MYFVGDAPSLFGDKLQMEVSNQVSYGCKRNFVCIPFICLSLFIHWRSL